MLKTINGGAFVLAGSSTGSPPVASTRIDDHVGVFQRVNGRGSHGALELVRRLEETGRVDPDDLRVALGANPDNRCAGRLRLWAT